MVLFQILKCIVSTIVASRLFLGETFVFYVQKIILCHKEWNEEKYKYFQIEGKDKKELVCCVLHNKYSNDDCIDQKVEIASCLCLSEEISIKEAKKDGENDNSPYSKVDIEGIECGVCVCRNWLVYPFENWINRFNVGQSKFIEHAVKCSENIFSPM